MTDGNAGFDESAGFNGNAGFSDGADGAGFEGGSGGGGAFDDSFFATLEAGPDEELADPVADEALDLGVDDGPEGAEGFQYEAEGDGSFETEAMEFEAEDFPFDLGGEG
jgi:hypothetical protein